MLVAAANDREQEENGHESTRDLSVRRSLNTCAIDPGFPREVRPAFYVSKRRPTPAPGRFSTTEASGSHLHEVEHLSDGTEPPAELIVQTPPVSRQFSPGCRSAEESAQPQPPPMSEVVSAANDTPRLDSEAEDAFSPRTASPRHRTVVAEPPVDPAETSAKVWALQDLLAAEFPAQPPLIEGLLGRGEMASLYGLGGSGKSMLALSLGLSLAAGVPWLGKFDVNAGRVLYVDQEGHERQVQERLRNLVQGGNLRHDIPFFYWQPLEVLVDTDAGYAQLHQKIAGCVPDLVILDSFTRYHLQDENSSRDMAMVMRKLASLTTDLGIALLLIDHTTKSEGSEAPGNRMRGSSDKFNTLDAAYMVKSYQRGASLRITPSKARYRAVPEAFSVAVTSTPESITLQHAQQSSAASPPGASSNEVLEVIQSLIDEKGQYAATIKAIGTVLFANSEMTEPQREGKVRRVLDKLEGDGLLRKQKVPSTGKRGKPAECYVPDNL